MRMAIQKNNGQWWTGSCWGVEQARATYDTIDDLPEEIEGAEKELRGPQKYPNVLYLAEDEADDAGVVEIG